MRITFLGHQGWHIENQGRSFLLDPILEAIGNGASLMPIWPPRRLDFKRFEPLDAVIISHEHADHFSLPTLAALPRRCRIYVSDLASFAMTAAIAHLGFQVERFSALHSFAINGVRVTALPGLYNTLEPDTYALLMQDASGASFLTAIDTVAHPDIFAWLDGNCPRRTLDNLTNNFVEPRQPLLDDGFAHTRSRSVVAGNAIDFVQKFQPRRAVVSGQGWSFKGASAHLNHSFFSVDNGWLTHTARELAPHVEWHEGTVGMRFTLHGEDCSVDQSSLVSVQVAPSRQFDPASVRTVEPFTPWSGVTELSPERFRKVQRFIAEQFGRILGAYAPKLMERLYYLKFQQVAGLAPTLAISLRNGGSRSVFELDYGHLMFREVHADAAPPSAVGFEVWAADMELMVNAEEEVFLLYESAVRLWSHVPGLDTASLIECFMWFTPRFRPDEFLSFYKTRIAALT